MFSSPPPTLTSHGRTYLMAMMSVMIFVIAGDEILFKNQLASSQSQGGRWQLDG